jgi:NAD(P)-dependent dehydrogenase (short-subunit alcohol dehydrogenase family)
MASGDLEGKAALVTGASRGIGRAVAAALARAGCDVGVNYRERSDDAGETARLVEAAGRRVVTALVDVRDADGLAAALGAGVAELGGLDVVLANAGIGLMRPDADPRDAFRDQLDVNLRGVWNTVQAAAPVLIEQGRGGAVVLTSSVFGLTGRGGSGRGGDDGYVASKHGVVGLMRTFATWLAPHGVRVNSVHPSGVATPMILNPAVEELCGGEFPKPTEDVTNLLDVMLVQPEDISAAVAFLASDEARYITGVALPVDAGMLVR